MVHPDFLMCLSLIHGNDSIHFILQTVKELRDTILANVLSVWRLLPPHIRVMNDQEGSSNVDMLLHFISFTRFQEAFSVRINYVSHLHGLVVCSEAKFLLLWHLDMYGFIPETERHVFLQFLQCGGNDRSISSSGGISIACTRGRGRITAAARTHTHTYICVNLHTGKRVLSRHFSLSVATAVSHSNIL